jgi:small GTP-binding protein
MQGDQYDETPDFNYKIILVGDARVGKTSITNRFFNDNFNPNEASSVTVQIQRKTVNIENTSKWAELHVWDTLGQEKFKSLASLFFKKSVGAFLVYDCTNKMSFDHLESWYSEISNNVDTRVIIMLLGTKCDLPNREVSYNQAMEYARAKNFGFLEVSAKTGTNINAAYNCLVRGNLSLIVHFVLFFLLPNNNFFPF